MALASWRVMAVSQNPCAEGDAFTRKEGQAAQSLSFTSIYDVCKSAKGVCLNRDSMLAAVLAGHFSMPRTGKRKGLGGAEAL